MTATSEAVAKQRSLKAVGEPPPSRSWLNLALPYLIAGGAYLLLSVFIWIRVWSGHPSSVTACGCGDTAATIWYTEWPAYALVHGQNPLFSTAIGYPTGVNLIFAAYGIVMAPFTWAFGPVSAVNVVLTVSPVLSALAMFALVRRWVSWAPAAFVAGLFYGFSPFVLSNLGAGHVDFIMLAIPPLVIICLDELLIRQRRRPATVGVLLGLLVSAQFFVSVEILALLVLETLIGIGLIVLYSAIRSPITLREHVGHAMTGAAVAALTTLVLLALPAWFAFAGPAHFSSVTHPGVQLTRYSASIANVAFPATIPKDSQWQHIVGAYQGPVLSPQYFGLGVILVCTAGIVIWRRDRFLWLFGALSLATLFLATSSGPWIARLPLYDNAFPIHFVPFVYLAVAVVLAVIVDHTRLAIRQLGGNTNIASNGDRSRRPSTFVSWGAAMSGIAVAVVAIAPPAAYMAKSVPLTVQAVATPTWFRTVAPGLQGHPVVLVLPAPFTTTTPGVTWVAKGGQRYLQGISLKQAALAWHTLSGEGYSIVGTGGLGVGVKHNPGEDQGQNTLTKVTFAYGSRPDVASSDIVAVHRALSQWGVTMIVLPDQPELPAYDQVASVTAMAALIAAATGTKPTLVANSWVWRGVNGDNPRTYPKANQFSRCINDLPSRGVVAVGRATACVLGSP